MKKIIGFLKNLNGKFFAKDEQGNLREIYPGDPLYEGELVVNESGIEVVGALRMTTQDEIDSNMAEANIEATLREAEFDKKTPETEDDAKSTTSTDTIDSELAESNLGAPLRVADFYTQNTGLIQNHELSEEVSVDAPLREYYFGDSYDSLSHYRFTTDLTGDFGGRDVGVAIGNTIFSII